MEIREKLKHGRLFFDGAMGTLLQKSGLIQSGRAPELLNITNPQAITDIHKQYLSVGCDIIKTNTFGATEMRFPNYEEIIKSGIECAQKARADFQEKYIAFSIGPSGKMLKPLGDIEFEDAVMLFSKSISVAAKYGADIILVETMNDCYETKAAVLAAKECCSLPVFVTNAYDMTGKLMTGADPKAMIAMLEGLGADAIGMNCSFGPDEMKKIVPIFSEYASVPLIVNPNAGLPEVKNGETVYNIDSEKFSDIMCEIARMGGCILGGCCGTAPEYIRKTVEKTKNIPYIYPSKKERTVISSYTHAVEIGNEPILIGERINPTGKKKFKEALKNHDMDYIRREAITQEEKGVHILDVNVGLPEIDEESMMAEAVRALQEITDLPLQIDTSSPKVLEKALRLYNGKALVNSVDASEEKMNAVFPIIKKYGAVVVALALDASEIPTEAEGRLQKIQQIVRCAQSYGIDKCNIIADPLAMTVSADPKSAGVTLDSIKLIKKETGIKTILGVSNISFGLPQRAKINSCFFAMALECGLDSAIMNPISAPMMDVYYSYCALKGFDSGCGKYINYASFSDLPVENAGQEKAEADLSFFIIKGMKQAASHKAEEMKKDNDKFDIINNYIIPALNDAGEKFEKKKIFLPQLLMCAEAATAAFEALTGDDEEKSSGAGEVILATVKGDIHDIGKNIVKVLMQSFGFKVTDLGKDVAPEKVLESAINSGCRLVGLSALMTTTVPSMEETIRILKDKLPDVKIIVGGAVLTQDYANKIGADYYAPDAMYSVNCAKEYYGEK